MDNKGVWYKGYVKEVQEGESETASYLVHLDKGVDTYGGGTEFMVTPRCYGQLRAEGEVANPNPANCSFGPPPGSFTNSSPASVSLFKRVLYNRLNMLATGVGGYPKQIGVSFFLLTCPRHTRTPFRLYPDAVLSVSTMQLHRTLLNIRRRSNAFFAKITIPASCAKMVETKWEFL